MSKTKTIGEYHQDKIRRQANKNPLEAYFLGGWELVSEKKKQQTLTFLNNINYKDGTKEWN